MATNDTLASFLSYSFFLCANFTFPHYFLSPSNLSNKTICLFKLLGQKGRHNFRSLFLCVLLGRHSHYHRIINPNTISSWQRKKKYKEKFSRIYLNVKHLKICSINDSIRKCDKNSIDLKSNLYQLLRKFPQRKKLAKLVKLWNTNEILFGAIIWLSHRLRIQIAEFCSFLSKNCL